MPDADVPPDDEKGEEEGVVEFDEDEPIRPSRAAVMWP